MSALVAAIALPSVVALFLYVARDRVPARTAAYLGVAGSLVSGVLVALAWGARGSAAYAGLVDLSWSETLNVRWHLGIDGISFPLVLLTVALSALVFWALIDDAPDGENSTVVLVALLLVIETAALGVFSALDLIVFFVFFELALVPMWFVIARWGDPHDVAGRHRAATRFLVFTVLGSAVMLIGFAVVGVQAGTLQIPELTHAGLSGTVATLGASAIAVGLAVKTPIWPLHIWLPDAHSKAPTVGSVILAGIFLKLGTYGLLRVLLAVAPEPMSHLAPWLAILGTIAIVYAAVACLRQRDLKRLVAYSSIGHMGFVVIAVSTMSEIGVVAAVYGSVAHGLISALLFFNAGSLKHRFASAEFGVLGRGMYGRIPAFACVFAFAAIASLGLPGLAGFWGEMLALRASFEVGPTLARPLAWTVLVVAALGVVLTSAYVVAVLRRMLQGIPTPSEHDADLAGSERGIAAVLVVGTLALGLVPGPLVAMVRDSAYAILGGGR